VVAKVDGSPHSRRVAEGQIMSIKDWIDRIVANLGVS